MRLLKFSVIALGLVLFLVLAVGSVDEDTPTTDEPAKTEKAEKADDVKETESEPEETEAPAEPKEYTFGSGNYYAGKDFEAGVYDITAIEGQSGNVISDNMFSGGINAIMGTDKEFAEQEYKNIELPDGTKLTISGGIKIKLASK